MSYSSSSTNISISSNTVTMLGAGTATITASQNGNSNWNSADPVSQNLVIVPASQMISNPVVALAGHSYTNRDTWSASYIIGLLGWGASSGLPVSLGVKSGPGYVSNNTLYITGAGSVVLSGNQAGNGNYAAAPEVSNTWTISQSSQTISNPVVALAGHSYTNSDTWASSYILGLLGWGASSGLPVSLGVKSGPGYVSNNTLYITGAGVLVLSGNQAGNSNYQAAPEVTNTWTISQGSQTISFGALSNRTYGAAPFSLGATASSGLPVSYSSVSTNISLSSNVVTILGAGTATITASQPGNTNWSASTPVSQSLVITPASQSINAFTTVPSQSYSNGATVSITPPTASSSLPVTVTVKSGPASISGNVVTLTGAGAVILAANQAGNANYLAATEVTTSFSVGAGSQSISFPTIPSQTYGNAPVTLGATASSGLPVSYSIVSGAATISSGNILSVTDIGTITVEARQEGSSEFFAAAPVRQSFVASKGSQTITFAPFESIRFGETSYSLTNASASSGLPVVYSSSAPKVASIKGNMLSVMGAGTTTITASQSGTAKWAAAANVSRTLVVLKASNTISSFATVNELPYVPNATVALPTPLPTASSRLPVTLSVKSGPAVMAGARAIKITGTGLVVLAANQAGNANYLSAPEVTTSFQITEAPQSISSFPAIANKTYGMAPFAVTIPKASSGLPVTLSVLSGPAIMSSNKVTLTGAGQVTLAANQIGNGNYTAAPEVTTSFNVAKANQAITFKALSKRPYGSPAFALAASASSRLPVVFNSTSTNIAITSNMVTILGAGTAVINASQSGDENWNPAANVSQTLVVTAPLSSTNTATNQIVGIGEASLIPSIPVRATSFPLIRPQITGSVVTWGDSTYLQAKVPSGLTNIVQLSTWGLHSLALRTNGTVSAWGWNAYGQTKVPLNVTDVVQVAAGVSYSAALRANGSVIAWGDNSLGQTDIPSGLTDAVQVAAGSHHALALRSDGTVTGWGWNNYDQTTIPPTVTNVVQIAAGYFHSVALKADGTVEVWGDNTYGETDVPEGLTNVVRIAVGLGHTVALKSDGTVVAWGWNSAGQTNVPAGLSGVTQIASGGNTVFAITTNGTLVTWGDNAYGQRKPPAGLSRAYQFVLGLYHGLGLKR